MDASGLLEAVNEKLLYSGSAIVYFRTLNMLTNITKNQDGLKLVESYDEQLLDENDAILKRIQESLEECLEDEDGKDPKKESNSREIILVTAQFYENMTRGDM